MSFPDDQIAELKLMFPGVAKCDEGNVTFFFLPNVMLPDGCAPTNADLLLCPTPRDGYSSRLFFSAKVEPKKVEGKQPLNWHVSNARLIEKNWFAFSWRSPAGLRLAQMVAVHLRALQ